MSFLMGWPLLLTGTLAASIPVLIHLLHRQRTVPVKWGAMRFLLDSPLQSRRKRRVDHWLLMAVRVAGLLLLAWALARPVARGRLAGVAGANVQTDIAIVVDRSLSTGRNVGDHTLFEEEIGVADSVAAVMRPGDSLSVILAEHRPRLLAPLPAGPRQVPALLQALRQIKPGLTDCSIPEAVRMARETLDHGRNSRKLILVASDRQKTNWHVGDPADWRAAGGASSSSGMPEVFSLALKDADPTTLNVSVGGVSVEPQLVGINRPAQILATLTNHGPKDAGPFNVRLTVDGKDSSIPAQVPALGVGQTTTLRFDHAFTVPGSHWLKISADLVDALPADNSAVAAVYVWQRLPVLIVDGQLTSTGRFRSAEFLQAAMQPVDPAKARDALVQPTILGAADGAAANLDDYFAVVLNDVAQIPASFEDKLADYAAAGHGVWVILGPRTRPEFITASLARMRLARVGLLAPNPRAPASPPAIQIKSTVNPMIAMIAASERNALAGAVTAKWWAVSPQDGDDQTVLATADGEPLVFEHPVGGNGGRVVVWATGADGAWNNWPVMPNFVPLVNETLYHLSAAQTRDHAAGNSSAGSPLSWGAPASPPVASIDVVLPDGSVDKDRKPTFRNGRWEFQYPNTFLPGLYELRPSPKEASSIAYYGVGIDPRELDPATLSEADVRWLADNHFVGQATPGDVAALITRQAGGAELWKWLAAFLLFMLVVETYLTYRMIGSAKKPQTLRATAPMAARGATV